MTKQGLTVLLAGALLSMGCGKDVLEEETARPVIQRYAAMTYDNYSEVVTRAQTLQTAVNAFVAAPSADKLTAARSAWLAARPSYGQSEAYRFYGGPIDNEDTGPEGRINSWPLDESYIDSVIGAPNSGLINATTQYPTLSAELIADANERDGETNIASGYHAIEFLLWGQDTSPTGPGNRPSTDFMDGGTRPNASRRREYLRLVTDMLVKDLQSVQGAWAPNQADYGNEFAASAPKEAVLKMLTGMGALSGGELTHERLSVAYDNKDQEDEHSCFSDNTLADLYNNELGIENVYLGRYGGVDGKGIDELVEAVNPALNKKMKEQLQASLAAIQAIPAPFDQAILGDDNSPGRVKIRAAIEALNAQTATIVEVATALGLKINLEE